jgi:ribosome-associated protein
VTDDEAPSRRQLAKQARREAGDRSSDLARTLMTMKDSLLGKVELDADLRDAVVKARAIPSQAARRRAERALGGELRRYELAEIEAQIATAQANAEPVEFHLAEKWRERLLADDAAAAEFPGGNVDPLPTLVARARSEAETGKPPGAKRALFRHIVAVLKTRPA